MKEKEDNWRIWITDRSAFPKISSEVSIFSFVRALLQFLRCQLKADLKNYHKKTSPSIVFTSRGEKLSVLNNWNSALGVHGTRSRKCEPQADRERRRALAEFAKLSGNCLRHSTARRKILQKFVSVTHFFFCCFFVASKQPVVLSRTGLCIIQWIKLQLK